jgi:hypothetical protein
MRTPPCGKCMEQNGAGIEPAFLLQAHWRWV